MSASRSLIVLGFVLPMLLATAACESGGEVRPWTPQDHDNNVRGNAGQVSGSAAPGHEDDTLVAVTWRQNCARCHGMTGRGDGPEGRMLRTPDLTRAAFQTRATDAEIVKVIKKGRNKMPAFETLPDNVVKGLVKHVRRLAR